MHTYAGVQAETRRALSLLSRALTVFGGGAEPVQPPRFAAAGDLEDALGRGHF